MPLKYQILLPMAVVTLLTIAALSVFSFATADRRATRQVQTRVTEIARTLEKSPFPLNEAVLEQVKGLTGAELATASDDDTTLISTLPVLQSLPAAPTSPALERVTVGGQTYLGSRIRLDESRLVAGASERFLCVLFPESAYAEQWQRTFWPPMIVGALALGAIAVLALVIHRQLSRPLEQLKAQVERIARGDFTAMPLPARRDEVHSLAASVNRMAAMLAESERQARQSERARTLGQLGGGLAHHLRNSVTGARIALDLHRGACGEDVSSLDMIQRQLTLMESYLQRFLRIGEHTTSQPWTTVDLREMLSSLEMLVRPRAGHVHVRLEMCLPASSVEVRGDTSELEQLFLNLMLNAVEAAAEGPAPADGERLVRVELTRSEKEAEAGVTVDDTGKGPAESMAEQLFEPFVTDKAEGVGLGLVVAQRAAQSHGGDITWRRVEQRTRFQVALPLAGASGEADRSRSPEHESRT